MIDIVERKLDTFLPVLLLIFGAKRVVCKSPYITFKSGDIRMRPVHAQIHSPRDIQGNAHVIGYPSFSLRHQTKPALQSAIGDTWLGFKYDTVQEWSFLFGRREPSTSPKHRSISGPNLN